MYGKYGPNQELREERINIIMNSLPGQVVTKKQELISHLNYYKWIYVYVCNYGI